MRDLALAGVGIWCFVVALAGGIGGLVLGNIRLPVFLFAASSPGAAGGANIAVSGLSAAAASISHIRAGRIHWRLAGWMLPSSVAGAVAGGAIASYVPADALRIVIGVVLLVFGVDLLRPRRATPMPRGDGRLDLRAAVLSGAAIGVLGGLVGLILGTLRLPALIRWVGEEPARAVGTNLVIGIFVGAAGLVGHIPVASTGRSSGSAHADRFRVRSSDRVSPVASRPQDCCESWARSCSPAAPPRSCKAPFSRRDRRRAARRARPPTPARAASAPSRPASDPARGARARRTRW